MRALTLRELRLLAQCDCFDLGHSAESIERMPDEPKRLPLGPRRILSGVAALVAAAFLLDLGWYQCRVWIPRLGAATGSVHRIRLLSIPGKGNKIEYQVDSVRPEEDVPCSNTLFPQGGYRPCWYVAKHANDPIPM